MNKLMGLFIVVAIFSFLGCAPSVSQQEKAIDIVWHGVYRMNAPPPELFWMVPPDLDCAKDTAGFCQGWFDRWLNECVAGEAGIDQWYIEVAKPDNRGWTIHDSALAHELLHAALYMIYGDSDLKHLRPEWNSWVPLGNFYLWQNGF